MRLPDVLTIKQAAELLGVSEVTLRRWDKSGKFSPQRHPLNGYRCYQRDAVTSLQRQISIPPTRSAPQAQGLAGLPEGSGRTTQPAPGTHNDDESKLTEEERYFRERAAWHRAQELRLRQSLDFSLQHSAPGSALSALLGVAGAFIDDDVDAEAFEQFKGSLFALVLKVDEERRGARAWHVHKNGCDADRNAIEILDFANMVAHRAYLFAVKDPQIEPRGLAALRHFQEVHLRALCGDRTPSLEQLEDWFSSHKGGKLSMVGLVSDLVRLVPRFGSSSQPRENTLKRVDQILARARQRSPSGGAAA